MPLYAPDRATGFRQRRPALAAASALGTAVDTASSWQPERMHAAAAAIKEVARAEEDHSSHWNDGRVDHAGPAPDLDRQGRQQREVPGIIGLDGRQVVFREPGEARQYDRPRESGSCEG